MWYCDINSKMYALRRGLRMIKILQNSFWNITEEIRDIIRRESPVRVRHYIYLKHLDYLTVFSARLFIKEC